MKCYNPSSSQNGPLRTGQQYRCTGNLSINVIKCLWFVHATPQPVHIIQMTGRARDRLKRVRKILSPTGCDPGSSISYSGPHLCLQIWQEWQSAQSVFVVPSAVLRHILSACV